MTSQIYAVLTSSSFLEKALLLTLGVVVTGLLVPLVKKTLDDHSARSKALMQARLARQKEVIDSQIALLHEFSELSWDFLFRALKVSYAYGWEGSQEQDKAWEYGPQSWELLTEIRALISKGKRLVDERTHQQLLDVYEWFLKLDDAITDNAEKEIPAEEWQEFHKRHLSDAASVIDGAVETLAENFTLLAQPIGDRNARPKSDVIHES